MIVPRFRELCDSDEIFLAFNIKYLTYVGLWPKTYWSKEKSFWYKMYEVMLSVLSVIYLVLTGIGTYRNKEKIIVFLSNLDKSIVAYNFVLKVIFFVSKREKIRILINKIVSSGDNTSAERKKVMSSHVIFITVFGTALVGAFSLAAQVKGEMLVDAWMPFDPRKNKMMLALSSQIVAITFVVPCLYRSFAMQGIVCGIIMYICDQLIELQSSLKALKYSQENEGIIRNQFREIVKKQVRLMGYAQSMSNVFKEFFLIQNLAVTVELCLNAIMVTLVGFEQKTLLTSFLAFLGIALLNAFIYCYLGNEMILQSEGVAFAAYEAEWTAWPLDLQKDLLLVIKVAQRPLTLSAGGIANMSLHTFGQALYNGYSIFAVLNDVVD